MKVFVLLVLVYCFVLSPVWGWSQNKSNEYGKVIGQIFDPETGKPVEEEFVVYFLNLNEENPDKNFITHRRTNEHGFLSAKVYPFTYCLRFEPESKDSKYCAEPYPFYDEKYLFPVLVKKGETTEFRKDAKISGSLRVRFFDKMGTIIKPKSKYPSLREIMISLNNKNILLPIYKSFSGDDLINSNLLSKSLYPDIYSVEISFYGIIFPKVKRNEIIINKNEISTIDIKIDIDEKTGIEGVITDQFNNPVADAHVFFTSEFSYGAELSTLTDKSGNYRLTGFPTNTFKTYVRIGKKLFSKGHVTIKSGEIIQQNFKLENFSIND